MTTAKPKLRTGARMSLDEFLALGETDERLELFDGVLYLMSSPSKDHQFLMIRIRLQFEAFLDDFDLPPCEVHHDMTTILSEELQRVVEPDLVVILAGRADIGGVRHVEGVPDIVVEILSSDRAHDLVFKRRIYAEAGVREYWIFDPSQRHRPAAGTAGQSVCGAGEAHRRRYPRHAAAARLGDTAGGRLPTPAAAAPGRVDGRPHDYRQAQTAHRRPYVPRRVPRPGRNR